MSESRRKRPLGRCSFLFLLALGFDVVGLILLLIGIFVTLELNGRSFGEFFIYTGGIMIFFSLLWWLGWYTLNLEVSIEDLTRDPVHSPKKSNLVQLARKVSERFSKRSRRKAEGAANKETPKESPSNPPLTTMTVFKNNGFRSSSHTDIPTCAGKDLELSENGGSLRVVDKLV